MSFGRRCVCWHDLLRFGDLPFAKEHEVKFAVYGCSSFQPAQEELHIGADQAPFMPRSGLPVHLYLTTPTPVLLTFQYAAPAGGPDKSQTPLLAVGVAVADEEEALAQAARNGFHIYEHGPSGPAHLHLPGCKKDDGLFFYFYAPDRPFVPFELDFKMNAQRPQKP